MSLKYWLVALASAASFTTSARAGIVTTIYNTGQDNNHNLLAGGSIDPHYTLIASADPAFPGPATRVVDGNYPVAPNGPWLANGPNSRWIAPRSDGGNEPAGSYVFHTTFDLSGYIPSTALINGQWTMDDHGLDLKINGVSTGITDMAFGAHENFAPFTINAGFVNGINTLDFNIDNTYLPIGFRVEMTLTATPAPEPSTFALLGVAALLRLAKLSVRRRTHVVA